jgi:ATP-dependent protease ClpP protease subunit
MKAITISGIIGWDTTPQDLREALNGANGDDVEITISSPGGLVFAGLEMFNLIRNYSGKTIARLSGYAMSMASYIPLAADRIVAEDNAIYMIHNVRGGVFGDHNEILKYGAATKGMSGMIMKAYAKRSGKTLPELEKMMDAETYLFGDEMVDHGFVDEIIDTGSDKDSETARALACVALQDCNHRMSADMSAVKQDLVSASQLIVAMSTQPKKQKGKTMNIETLKAEHPDLVEAITAEALADMPTTVATARTEGALAERDRIASVRATLIPGHEALVEAMAADGVSTAADAALAIIGAEKQLQKVAAAALNDEAPPVVPPGVDQQSNQITTMKRLDFNALTPSGQRSVIQAGTKIID